MNRLIVPCGHRGAADQNPRLPRERAPTQGLVAGEFQVDKAMEKLEVS